jgi:hypothetical protein
MYVWCGDFHGLTGITLQLPSRYVREGGFSLLESVGDLLRKKNPGSTLSHPPA